MIPHGYEQTRMVSVDNGKQRNKKKEKYCRSHGFIDLFACGGAAEWQRLHGDCREEEPPGNAVPVWRAKLAKAA